MKITKYYLDKELKFILCNIHEIKLKYSIFRQLYLDENFTNINLRLRSISVIFFELLLKNILMELSKLVVDSGDEDISIKRFIINYDASKYKYVTSKKYIYITDKNTHKKKRFYLKGMDDVSNDINKLKQMLIERENIRIFLQFVRNKKIAHNDKRIFLVAKNRNNGITYEELENYINDIHFLFNKIYTDIYGKQIYFSNNVISELNYLNKVLK